MRFTIVRAALIAAALFVLLFGIVFWLMPVRSVGLSSGLGGSDFSGSRNQLDDSDKASRKNYATGRQQSPPTGVRPPSGETQKYEKIASVSQSTTDFAADRAKVTAAIEAHTGLIQVERAAGLEGRRSTYLGIGVPPDKFDTFVEALQKIGESTQIDIVKNDKTNEYLELKARRTTLEKARNALEAVAATGGSIDERINLQGRLTEIEEKLQALGVSLGEFDTQNELCTVRLTLIERKPPPTRSISARLFDALSWTAAIYAGIAAGFLMLTAALWFAVALVDYVLRLVRNERTGGAPSA